MSNIITNINQLDPNGTYSYSDYLNWKFDEYVELIKGKLLEISPAPSRKHQAVLGNLYGFMFPYFQKSPCQVYVVPFDVRLPSMQEGAEILTVLQPDLCVICDVSKLDEKGCLGAPDLVVEVVSIGNTKKEMRQKFAVYQEAGVREYWIVHPHDHNVIIYQLNDEGNYIGLPPLTEDDILTTTLFPELSVQLFDVFNSY